MIKKILTLCFTLFVLIGCSEKQKNSTPFLHNNKANEMLLELSTLTNADITKDDNLLALVTKTQRTWYQKGKERWEMDLPVALQKDKKIADKIIRLCTDELHLDQDILPDPNTSYDGVFFLGATFSSIIKRLDFYLNLVQSGHIRKDLPLWVLTGERTLNKNIGETQENFAKIIDPTKPPIPFPTNEREMIQFVFYHRLPRTLQADFIDSPKEKGAKRATTESTMEAFLQKTGKTSGHFLCISSQPYVYYQETALLAKLHQLNLKTIAITCIGPKMEAHSQKNQQAALLLDNVAKVLYNLGRTKNCEKESVF